MRRGTFTNDRRGPGSVGGIAPGSHATFYTNAERTVSAPVADDGGPNLSSNPVSNISIDGSVTGTVDKPSAGTVRFPMPGKRIGENCDPGRGGADPKTEFEDILQLPPSGTSFALEFRPVRTWRFGRSSTRSNQTETIST